VEAIGGALWGVVCGAAIGLAAGGLYLLLGPELVAFAGVVPVGTLGGVVVGGFLALARLASCGLAGGAR
jgi:hypothetical protein